MIQNILKELLELTWNQTNKTEALLYAGSKSKVDALPASLKELYSYADGQKENHTQLFNNFYFMSSDNCIETKRSLDEQSIEEGWKEIHWWEETWFPFGEDGMGQYLVVDKNSGKVLEFQHDNPERPIIAESLEAYLQDLVNDLKSGETVYDNELGIVNAKEFELFLKEKESPKSKGSLFLKTIGRRILPRRPTRDDILEWVIALIVGAIFIFFKNYFFK